ncbi:TPA: hypothetical protein RQL08_004254 [Vibrio vulnificus]|nr:hypothetical protein [Vibrio vulnificus]HDY8150469.1 hypothetical protein [Vibrio vulnificus]
MFNAVIVGAYQVIANLLIQSAIEVGNSTLSCAVVGKHEGICCNFVVLPHWGGEVVLHALSRSHLSAKLSHRVTTLRNFIKRRRSLPNQSALVVKHNKQFKQTLNAWHFQFAGISVVTALCRNYRCAFRAT